MYKIISMCDNTRYNYMPMQFLIKRGYLLHGMKFYIYTCWWDLYNATLPGLHRKWFIEELLIKMLLLVMNKNDSNTLSIKLRSSCSPHHLQHIYRKGKGGKNYTNYSFICNGSMQLYELTQQQEYCFTISEFILNTRKILLTSKPGLWTLYTFLFASW